MGAFARARQSHHRRRPRSERAYKFDNFEARPRKKGPIGTFTTLDLTTLTINNFEQDFYNFETLTLWVQSKEPGVFA